MIPQHNSATNPLAPSDLSNDSNIQNHKNLEVLSGSLPTANREQALVEHRAHGIFEAMVKGLPAGIVWKDAPTVIFDPAARTSYFDHKNMKIIIAGRNRDDGYVYGEELAHWFRHTLAPDGVSGITPLAASIGKSAQSAVVEFFGFIGRAVAANACTGTCFEVLFSPEGPSAPADYAQMATSARTHCMTGKANLSAISGYSALIETTILALKGLLRHPLLTEAANPAHADSFAAAVRSAQEELQRSGSSVGKLAKKLEPPLLLMFERVSLQTNELKSLSAKGGYDFLYLREQLSANMMTELQLLIALDLELNHKELSASAEACDYTGHGAGYTSAALALEGSNTPAALFSALVTLDSATVYFKHIVCDGMGVRKSSWTRIVERAIHFFNRLATN